MAYFKQFQAIFKEFNFITTPDKNLLIYYFYNELKLFILAQLDKKDCNLDYCNNVVKEAINIKANTHCQLFFYISKSNTHYFCSY